MANININNLKSIGSDLFSDSESYLQALSDEDLMVRGGRYDEFPTVIGTSDVFTPYMM